MALAFLRLPVCTGGCVPGREGGRSPGQGTSPQAPGPPFTQAKGQAGSGEEGRTGHWATGRGSELLGRGRDLSHVISKAFLRGAAEAPLGGLVSSSRLYFPRTNMFCLREGKKNM